MTEETREALEDQVFDLPLMRERYPSTVERDMIVRNMSDDELQETLTVSQSERVESKPEPVSAPKPVQTRNSEKRNKRVKRVKTGETFIEKDGRLYRREDWVVIDSQGNIHRDWHDYPCGQRVRWEGRLVSASVVMHWLRTGEHVKRVPKPPKAPAKPFRAVVRYQGKTKHIGCFATVEERDAAIFSFKLGLTS